MEKASIIFSILTHDFGFMLVVCLIVTFPLGLWHTWYFPSKNWLPEKRLTEISQEFIGVNSRYMAAHVFWILGFLLFTAMCFIIDKWSTSHYGIRFYPISVGFSMTYGIFQGLFAITSGVYPMAKSLSYVYDDGTKIKRIAQYQILISIVAFMLISLFFFIASR